PTGRSSTGGVLPINSRTLVATVLCIPREDVDRRTRLPEDLVDAPHEPGSHRLDRIAAVPFDQLGLPPIQARECEEVGDGVPRSVLEHSFAPLTVKLLGSNEMESGFAGRSFEELRRHVLRAR